MAILINPNYCRVAIPQLEVNEINGFPYLHIKDGESNKAYHISTDFISSFHKLFGVSSKIAKEVPFKTIFDMFTKVSKDHEYKIYVNDACASAVAIMKASEHPIGVDLAERLFYQLKSNGYLMSDLHEQHDKTEFIVINPMVIKMFNDHESYRMGGMTIIPHSDNSSIKVLAVLERTASGKLAIFNNKATCLYIKNDKSPDEAIKEIAEVMSLIGASKRQEFFQLIEERLNVNQSTIASIGECVIAGASLNKGLRDMIGLPKVLNRYKVAAPSELPPFTPSDINRLTLFHLMMDAGGAPTCDAEIEDEDASGKWKARVSAGKFLFTTCDLEKAMTESKRESITPIDDGDDDICSISDYDDDFPTTKDDDDIASF